MEEVCKICGEKFSTGKHFFLKHGIKQEEYYQRYFPRKDLHDGSPIVFKDKDSYLRTFFNSKTNMALWMRQAKKEEAIELIKTIFNFRIAAKKLSKVPSQVELRSLETVPTITIINKTVGGYYDIMKSLPLKSGFSAVTLPKVATKDIKVAIDTREQRPLELTNTKSIKLDYGDYTAIGEDFSNVFIDRKSLNDFVSTFTLHLKRFEKELIRAKEFGAYIVVLVEESFLAAKNFEQSYISKFTKVSSDHLFKNVRDLMQKYDNVQFLFADNRLVARNLVKKILLLKKEVKNIDLQYFYDMGLL